MASSAGAKKAVKKLTRDLRKAGYTVGQRGGHARVYDPATRQKVGQFSLTPHSEDAVKKMRAEMKRDGLRI